MINGYRMAVIILILSIFHNQLQSAETQVQPKATAQSAPKTFSLNYAPGDTTEPVKKTESKQKTESPQKPPAKKTESAKGNAKSNNGQFIPSEAISEDLSVSFPVDI